MDGARSGRDDQRAARVLVQQPGGGAAIEIADGIASEVRCRRELRGTGHDLQQQRVAGIAAAHARDITTRHAQREFTSRRKCGRDQRGVEVEHGAQLGWIGDRVSQRLLPKKRLRLAGEGGCGYHLRPFRNPPFY
jgi:hypothetical protein